VTASAALELAPNKLLEDLLQRMVDTPRRYQDRVQWKKPAIHTYRETLYPLKVLGFLWHPHSKKIFAISTQSARANPCKSLAISCHPPFENFYNRARIVYCVALFDATTRHRSGDAPLF
jgi:hypothetical protein